MGSRVPPAVTTTCRPARSASRAGASVSGGRAAASAARTGRPATAATTASTIAGSSASRPTPDCPDASGPASGSTMRVAEVVAQAGDVRPGGRVRPHVAVHRGRDDDRRRAGEARGGDDVGGEPVGHRAEPVRGRRRDDDRVGAVADDDVADPAVGEQVEQVGLDGVARQRPEGQRADEPRRRRRQHDRDVGPLGRQEAQQLHRLVGGDRPGDPEPDEPPLEPTAHDSPSSSRWPPTTSAWRIARPLSVSSGIDGVDAFELRGPRRRRTARRSGPRGRRRAPRRSRRRARRGSARAARRRAPGSPRTAPDCMAETVSRPIARSGARNSTCGSLAVRAASASSPSSRPGAIAPPT